jgi:VWFA-related protein
VKSLRYFAVLAAVLVLAGPLPAAKKTPTPRPIGGLTFTDEYELTVVNVDVFVRDKKGRPVKGLTRDDFKIYQDGVEKPISNFAVYTQEVFEHRFATPSPGATPTPQPKAAPAPEIKPIYVVIYVDNENLKPLQRNRVLRKLRQWVRDTVRPPMQVMVVTYQKSLKVVQPFTSDPREINEALRSIRMQTGGRVERDSARADIIDLMNEYRDQERERPNAGRQNRQLFLQAYRQISAFADEEANNLRFSLGAMREMVTMLAGLPGRKSMLYISDGLPMVPGVDLIYEFMAVFHDQRILSLVSRYDMSKEFESLTAFANGQGVSIYAVETQGLKVESGISAEHRYTQDITATSVGSHNYQDSLRYLAENTGGLAIVNTNNVSPGLDLIRQDLYTYYSLGYTINASGGDKVHRIKVECPTHPEYKLRYRRRFIEKSLESRVQDKVMTALVFDLDENPMQVDVIAGRPAPATSDRWTVPVHITFPLRKVALIPEGDDYVGRVVLFVAARDRDGKQSDLQRQEHEVRIPAKDYDEAQRKRFSIDVNLLMEKGGFTVAVGLMDQITRQASYKAIKLRIAPDER